MPAATTVTAVAVVFVVAVPACSTAALSVDSVGVESASRNSWR